MYPNAKEIILRVSFPLKRLKRDPLTFTNEDILRGIEPHRDAMHGDSHRCEEDGWPMCVRIHDK